MSGLSLREAVTADILSTVLTETQFGTVSECRFALAIVLTACLAYDRPPLARSLALASGLGLVAGIAWTGHAGSTAGDWANLHLTADVLHLVAAAAWLGGLVPLALLLSQARRNEAMRGPRWRRRPHGGFPSSASSVSAQSFQPAL